MDVRELDLVCVHQPSQPFVDAFRARMDIDPAQIIPTFPHTGNAAAATLPLQLAQAVHDRRLGPRRRRRPVRPREWSQRRGDAAALVTLHVPASRWRPRRARTGPCSAVPGGRGPTWYRAEVVVP
ncbi:hypothetical protein GCM10020254_80300 [Streptomyces goshikiensis]